MAQWDIILVQNVHATPSNTEFAERVVNFGKGGILTANGSNVPTILTPGTDGYVLSCRAGATNGIEWIPAGSASLADGIFDWVSANNRYEPYTDSTTVGAIGRFYGGSAFYTAGTSRLNYTGGLWVNSSGSSAIYGLDDTGHGVHGEGGAVGVYGATTSGHGVYGYANTGRGVGGFSTSWAGVFGESNSSYGVYATSNTGIALYSLSITGVSAVFVNHIDNISNIIEARLGTSVKFYVTKDGLIYSYGDLTFADDANRTISIATTSTSVSRTLSILGQNSSYVGYGFTPGPIIIKAGDANGNPGGTYTVIGGPISLTGGHGAPSNYAGTLDAGTGGLITITGGTGGVNTGGVSGAYGGLGGNVVIVGGSGGSGYMGFSNDGGSVYIYGGITGLKGNTYLAYSGSSAYGLVGVGGAIELGVMLKITGSIKSTSSILSNHATAGIGYATGAGGTQTQASTRSTGVTLNTVCGSIVGNTTSLAAAAEATFIVTNSAVTTNDAVFVYMKSGDTNILCYVSNVSNGSFSITQSNLRGSASTAALTFGFMVFKGVVS